MKKTLVIIILLIPSIAIIIGQLGLLSGRVPKDLGVRDGKLKPPSKTPNSVSSQAHLHSNSEYDTEYAQMNAFPMTGSVAEAKARLKQVILQQPESKLIEETEDYLRYEFTTRLMKYVDDVEFYFSKDEKKIHFRSASRLGRKDFGKNRSRLEQIDLLFRN
ncbi:MAG: hypothetical protein A2622_07075 [Bdellovibrionales bacterium RIFCSPHIGHO2_01_FULL_40_29]|nr:MAG: hypothetical protein A2622_07075 [Bdellovibrionales bacterium RIFCSPHIGHO2_01_FULL_40_29]OFZ33237.1 MAG: hypothetical protein A3D17_12095 [Bdellovibrionales bacterium RIFCSPHIGHO2_02_FULL_40_15]